MEENIWPSAVSYNELDEHRKKEKASKKSKKKRRRSKGDVMSRKRKLHLSNMTEIASKAQVRTRAAATLRKNTKKNAGLEVARVYKEEHGIGATRTQEIHTVLVPVKAKKKSHSWGVVELSVDHLMSGETRKVFRTWLRRNATTKGHTMFVDEILEEANKMYKLKLTKKQMYQVLSFMGIEFVVLRSGHYGAKQRHGGIVNRRKALMPMLWHLYHHPKVFRSVFFFRFFFLVFLFFFFVCRWWSGCMMRPILQSKIMATGAGAT